MEFATTLWMPIVVSAVAIFVLSALVWIAFPHHKKEFGRLPNDDAVLRVIRDGNAAPGLYMTPHFASAAERESAEGKAKLAAGPIAFVTVIPDGMRPMGPMMIQSLVANLFISAMVAYLAWHALPAGADYLSVFRITGTASFMAYGLATIPESIWFGRPWSSYWLGAFDAGMYALVAAGIFGAMWP